MTIKYTNSFHCETLQNLPNRDFWFEKCHLATLQQNPTGNRFYHLPQNDGIKSASQPFRFEA
jgi:hypothetical protein